MELKEMEAALEAVLFAAGEPVGVERLCLSLEADRPTLDAVAQRLMDQYSYERRGIRLLRLDASYQMCSAPEYADYVRKTLESRKPARLSQPALEVLAIIAYYQPVTRAYVDQVRGVDSSYTVGLLLERDLIEESGRLAVPGRPILYRTTKTFLRSFGLSSLEELPELPSGTQEGDQMTLKLEEAVAKLKAEEARRRRGRRLRNRRREGPHDLGNFPGRSGGAGPAGAHPPGLPGDVHPAGGGRVVPPGGLSVAALSLEEEKKAGKAQGGEAAAEALKTGGAQAADSVPGRGVSAGQSAAPRGPGGGRRLPAAAPSGRVPAGDCGWGT